MGPWEMWRTSTVVVAGLAAITLFITLMAPIGFLVFGILVTTAYVTKPIGEGGSNGSHYIPDSKGFERARFLIGYKLRIKEATKPLVVFGFGPAHVDNDHGYQPGWKPIGRLSSFWSYFAAICLAFIDVLLRQLHMNYLPNFFWFIMAPLSVVGWLYVIQSINFIRSMQADKTGIVGIEAAPSTMISSLKSDYDIFGILRKAFFMGLAISISALIIGFLARLNFFFTLAIMLLIVVVTMLAAVSKMLTKEYRAGWQERVDRRAFWSGTLGFLRDNVPTMIQEYKLPSIEEWEEMRSEEDEMYVPSVQMAVFMFAPNATFSDYANAGIEERIKGALEAAHVAISPIPARDPDTGEEIIGSIGSQGFRIWWTTHHVDIGGVLDPNTDDWLREFGTRSAVISVVNQIRGLGYSNVVSCSLITRKQSALQIIEVKIAPTDPNVNISNFQNQLATIERNIGVGWVRAYRPESAIQAGAPLNVVKLLIALEDPITFEARQEIEAGASGRPQRVRFSMPATAIRKIIHSANWEYHFRVNNVQSSGAGDVPKLIKSTQKTAVVNELMFSLPDGLEFSRVSSNIEGIKQTSGNSFMEITQGRSDFSSNVSQEELDKIGAESKSMFTVVASKQDPLSRIFSFGDYEDRILSPRDKGNERITWHPGVLANDDIATDSFNADEPHLLIAGTSGSGKSVVLQSMILQIAHNNMPDDAVFWMIEPKIGMQRFRHLDSVQHFVDPWSFDGQRSTDQFFENSATMLEMAVAEMMRRNDVLQRRSMVPGQNMPEKLSDSRKIAKREGPKADGTPHEMMFPYVFLIIEECATVYTGARDKDVATTISECAGRIAREGRSAGIYMINLTQYPTNASIPSLIKQQMRRLGLATNNEFASRVILDQNGLEKLRIKGTGLIKSGYGYRQYRGFLLRDGDTAIGEPNDILDISKRIPLSAMAKSLGVSTSSDPNDIQRFLVPNPGPSIFDLWKNSKKGLSIQEAVAEGKPTDEIM